MRGVNLGGWFSQIDAIQEKDPDSFADLTTHIKTFLGPADFARIKAWGFDHVRLPVDYFNVFHGPELQPAKDVLQLLDQALDSLAAAGLNVIFDLHKCPGHDFHLGTSQAQEFFSDPARREEANRVWQYLASRYGAHKNLLFELLNEPVAEQSEQWDVVKDELAALIRQHAPTSTLVIGTNRWNSPGEFAHLTPVRDDNVIYSFHFYSPVIFTHQHAPWISGDVFDVNRPYPGNYTPVSDVQHRLPLEWGVWDRPRMLHELQTVVEFRQKHRVSIACNEFGVFAGGPDRASQLRWMQDFTSILSELRIGMSYWNYKNLDFGLLSQGERAYADYPQYCNRDRIDAELVEILLRTAEVV